MWYAAPFKKQIFFSLILSTCPKIIIFPYEKICKIHILMQGGISKTLSGISNQDSNFYFLMRKGKPIKELFALLEWVFVFFILRQQNIYFINVFE
jgi:hypothetical protein